MYRKKSALNSRDSVQYKKAESDENNYSDDFLETQFRTNEVQPTPWRAITLAILLCIGGIVMLLLGFLILGEQLDVKYSDRMWPFLVLGSLMLTPGAYYTRIAYLAYKEIPGYSYADIPEFE